MAFRSMKSYSGANPPLAERITEDPVTNKTAQSTVTCGYQTHIAGYLRNVTVLWCRNLMNHSLCIMVYSLEGDCHYSCKIDLKPWQFWSKKGCKSIHAEGNLVEIYWDLRLAKFSGGPEPYADYYVALVWEEEVVLLLGDSKKKAYKRTKSRPAIVEAIQYYKKENVFDKKSFATRAKFDEKKREHEIVVGSSTNGPKDPEMWISIDGIVMIQVKNLQWKFRGNQTVLVDKQPVQVLWNVHDWLFSGPGTGHGLFIFKPSAPEVESEGSTTTSLGCDSETSNGSRYHTAKTWAAPEFCLLLYAWKME
ncbi:uncharacterized protein LOC123216384 [Mangifera indica]|uniref:uncharacterized protein LOC123216384 n=1 Tax=Mangifera indica TaxID=29780 RepID=UPI001CF99AB9|nr:uncharacterized protein LOC123216384 [Mangifera indica]